MDFAFCFGLDQSKILVSLATDCSHRLKWRKYLEHDRAFVVYRKCFILVGNEDRHKILDEFDIRPDRISFPLNISRKN